MCQVGESCSSCRADCGSCGSSAGKPNVVFILADDLGFGDLKSYGHPYARTPNLDRLASEGTRFERFYVSGVTCAPSRTGFMTSRHPASFKDYPARYGYSNARTVTEILSNAGYGTAHLGKWHMGDGNETIDNIYGIQYVNVMGKDEPEDEDRALPVSTKASDNGRDFGIFKAAASWIGNHVSRNANQAFYVNVWIHSTHFPVNPANALATQFKNVTCKRDDFPFNMQERFDACEQVGGSIVTGMRNYLGDVHGIDIGVGHLLNAIDQLGLKDNTIVVFSSDQGPGEANEKHGAASATMLGYSGGLKGGKHDQYEGGVRVPMIIRWPGKVPAGTVNKNSIFSSLDWLPTLASIAGVGCRSGNDFDRLA